MHTFLFFCGCFDVGGDCIVPSVSEAWHPFFVFLFVLWVLFCVLDFPVFYLPCFLFYFECLSCLCGVYLHLTSVNFPNCLHLPLICSFMYLSLVFPFVFAGSSVYFLWCLCLSCFPVPALLPHHHLEAPVKFGFSFVNKPPFDNTPAFLGPPYKNVPP